MTFKDRILEEANQGVANSVSKLRVGDMVGAVPLAPAIAGNMHAGYMSGKELNHPLAGLFLGAEGAAGARSMSDEKANIDIKDVYTQENIIKRAALMGIPAAAIGAMLAGPAGAAAAGATGAIIGGGIKPGANYGLGKVFGDRNPNTKK